MRRLAGMSTILFVIVIVLMLVVSLPTWLLSVLILANLSLSLVVTAVAMGTPRPLDFSSFPSLLLLTTLFRLALSVSTARLILLQANAGSVVQAFGQFVVGGNPAVGFILFLLLFIVQFMVITRGAERVSEVAARFTLDAMPGKQMAIDADLHAGVLTEAQARERRREIALEADFYGAMDGSAKFVRGDAMATLVILLVNVAGGLLIGMVERGLSFSQAFDTYTLLSVGDAIAAQLPAILLSVATGIIVTRSGASGQEMAAALGGQLFGRSQPLYVVAALIAALGVVTPVGLVPALALAAGLVWIASRIAAMERVAPAGAAAGAGGVAGAPAPPPAEPAAVLPDPVALEFGYGLLGLADPERGGDLLARVTAVRRALAEELGFVVPPVRVRDNVQLPPQAYVVRLRGVEVARGEVIADRLLAMSVSEAAVPGIPTRDPVFGLPALWITPAQREAALAVRATVVEPSAVIATHVSEVLRRRAHELLRREDARAFLDRVRQEDPAVVEELSPQVLPPGVLHRVLANLLREGVPIADGVTICEALADGAAQTKDPDALTEVVRRALGRSITRAAAGGGRLAVVTLDAALEQDLLARVQRTTDGGGGLELDPAARDQVVGRLAAALEPALSQGRRAAVVTTPLLRPHLRRALERALPDVPVLSYGELDPEAQVEPMGMVTSA
ncbi:MAG: flagellar biosynthesis protein FlhA [Firmicutes bacterium]|nr:flagellar biosynthesis protein FlhA [Bacillota bacterium]